ncbi:uncharacterized protein BHQ10_007240 [Talaromyces amestolkiae]|uniref:Transcriptional coactivator p15 (PC4) C-terminal domain-containing protein n=1 Tax=Talaromyces amestolkiae TaxID=1196081 RepID=A0A364L5Z0_TALAM|nr:uncharacterized protein BHQ10_007240 [Talaromyces amestolkiae]RAO71228.1 hypothetical protein BHQ10_007240 [Talaromyces amestolkiae]
MSYKSKKRSNDYQSDDFVVDDTNKNDRGAKKAKTASSGASSATQKIDSNGDIYWDISSHRRITISEFRGKSMVNIREYYEKDGQELPGKKGISLPIEQFNALIGCLPEIEQVLSAKGISVPRPAYNGASGVKEDEGEASGKKNIDTTSDEDEDEDDA